MMRPGLAQCDSVLQLGVGPGRRLVFERVLDLASKTCEGLKNTVSVITEMQRRRPPRTFHPDRVLRPFHMSEARAQSLLGLCKGGGGGGPSNQQEFYIDHFTIPWTTRSRTMGAPLLLLVTSARVVLGDEARLRPLWEVPVERIARVERKADHVMLWTWEKLGVGIGSEHNSRRTRTTSSSSAQSCATTPSCSRPSSTGSTRSRAGCGRSRRFEKQRVLV